MKVVFLTAQLKMFNIFLTWTCVFNKFHTPLATLLPFSESLPLQYPMQLLNYISRVVKIGEVPLGGDFPIRVQSMTSTDTMDTAATVAQAIRMIEAGCEFVRITAQGLKEAENLTEIKKELKKQGYKTPLIADIHYNPKAAEVAAKIVEKVRINPGNYTDRKKGKPFYSDSDYAHEVSIIRERIKPLIDICKQHGTALRIGSNHGSLSERILLRYGDTPAGMVESALEFVRICQDFDFHNIVLSMKASNVKVMVQANRLLVIKMTEEDMNYPIHLGVTEAGNAEDGRIKSAAGIGPMLAEGIGDTIRVSLTEDPEYEIPVAKMLVSRFTENEKRRRINYIENNIADPFNYKRRLTFSVEKTGNLQVPVVITSSDLINPDGFSFDKNAIPDYLFYTKTGTLHSVIDIHRNLNVESSNIKLVFVESADQLELKSFRSSSDTVLVINTSIKKSMNETRRIINSLINNGIEQPVILCRDYSEVPENNMLIQAATDFSILLIDGFIDGIWIIHQKMDLKVLSNIAFGILQATGSRITKTEYIACPSCGRTLFNIQETLQKIKSRTSHLKGIKIGVMGCCVNGPGEMADADYGYVGAGRGKITLYKGQQIIQAGITENEAVDSLISIIKMYGDWKEKEPQN
jgi:(E)-4-hydroxy-3-methylbut-2-enyl-diphosphate synthase